jgi:hypothetical protein
MSLMSINGRTVRIRPRECKVSFTMLDFEAVPTWPAVRVHHAGEPLPIILGQVGWASAKELNCPVSFGLGWQR